MTLFGLQIDTSSNKALARSLALAGEVLERKRQTELAAKQVGRLLASAGCSNSLRQLTSSRVLQESKGKGGGKGKGSSKSQGKDKGNDDDEHESPEEEEARQSACPSAFSLLRLCHL